MSLKKSDIESENVIDSTLSVTSVVDLPLDQEEQYGPSSVERVEDSNASMRNSSEKPLTSLLFVIPLPNPEKNYLSAHNAIRPVLLYTLPRAVYEKPPRDPLTGKRPREKFSKKISRSWNKSIQDGEDIQRGDLQSPSITKKCLGAVFRWTALSLRFITTCDNQILARLPPIKKLGQVQIFSLGDPTLLPIDWDQTHESQTSMSPVKAVEENLIHEISQAKKETKIRIILSGFILPVALAAEIFVPLVFEICLIYFVVQYTGWKKVKILLNKYRMEQNRPPLPENDLENGNPEAEKAPSTCCTFEFKVIESEICQEIRKLVHSACSQLDSHKFPILQDTTINSKVLIIQEEVIERTTILTFESDSKCTIDPDVKKELPVVEDTRSTVAQIPNINNSITIEVQCGDKNTVTLDTVQGIDEDAQVTDMTEAVPKNELQNSASSHVPSSIDRASTEPQEDRKASLALAGVLENETNSVIKSSDAISPRDKKKVKTVPHLEIATSLIQIFKASLPPNVVARHELNERRVAEDFYRILTRRTKEYVKSIKKIS